MNAHYHQLKSHAVALSLYHIVSTCKLYKQIVPMKDKVENYTWYKERGRNGKTAPNQTRASDLQIYPPLKLLHQLLHHISIEYCSTLPFIGIAMVRISISNKSTTVTKRQDTKQILHSYHYHHHYGTFIYPQTGSHSLLVLLISGKVLLIVVTDIVTSKILSQNSSLHLCIYVSI